MLIIAVLCCDDIISIARLTAFLWKDCQIPCSHFTIFDEKKTSSRVAKLIHRSSTRISMMKIPSMLLQLALGVGFVAAAFGENPFEVSADRELAHQLCRCQASWETNMYNGGRLLDSSAPERELMHHYRYQSLYWDGQYWNVEGVRVMPADSPYCGTYEEQRAQHIDSIFIRKLVEEGFYNDVVQNSPVKKTVNQNDRRTQCTYSSSLPLG